MTANFPSVYSFYRREVNESSRENPGPSAPPSDGFSDLEVAAALDTLQRSWSPVRPYDRRPIAHLHSGFWDVEITGRIANFVQLPIVTGYQPGANGSYLLVVKDNSGAIIVKLHYLKTSDYQILLGQRITVWATYISESADINIGPLPQFSYAISVYCGDHGASHAVLHKDDCQSMEDRSSRIPLGLSGSTNGKLPGLMTLKTFVTSGHELQNVKILVCVKAIGRLRIVDSRAKHKSFELMEVMIFDDTMSCTLQIWGDKIASAMTWRPVETILLISNPILRTAPISMFSKINSAEVAIGYCSLVDIDPELVEACWLRNKVKCITLRERVLIPFPDGMLDSVVAANSRCRDLFTIAEVDKKVCTNPSKDFTGILSVIIMQINLARLWRKRMMCCCDCCGVPLYSNTALATCKYCGLARELSINPHVLGELLDETGSLSASQIVWQDQAWSRLFFGDQGFDKPSKEDLFHWPLDHITALDPDDLRKTDERLRFSRVTLKFGWCSTVGRLCVSDVQTSLG